MISGNPTKLMMRHVWRRNIILKKRVEALKQEKEDLTAWQTKVTDNAVSLGNRIEKMEQEKGTAPTATGSGPGCATCSGYTSCLCLRNAELQPMSKTATAAQSSPTTSLEVQLPSHQDMGGHVRFPTALGPNPPSMATPDSLPRPPVLTPIRGLSPGPNAVGTPTLPELTPQRSASLAALPSPGQEEDMDSEPQKGSEY